MKAINVAESKFSKPLITFSTFLIYRRPLGSSAQMRKDPIKVACNFMKSMSMSNLHKTQDLRERHI